MPVNITMPALSPTMEEGNLAKWLVKPGDKVAPGDVIAEIETDKATMEVEAVDEGTVARIVVPEGTEGVKVNALIAVLAVEGEDVDEAGEGVGEEEPQAQKGRQTQPAPAAAPAVPPGEAKAAPAPAAAPPAVEAAAAPASRSNGARRVFASPLARRIAREAGIDVAAGSRSGPHGRIAKADIEAAIAGGGANPAAPAKTAPPAAAPPAAPAAPRPMADDQVLKLFAQGSYELVPHDGMRKTIARRLVEAKSTIPHFYLTLDCELDALLKLRAELNAAAPVTKTDKGEVPAYKLSVNDLVIKALALAVRDV